MVKYGYRRRLGTGRGPYIRPSANAVMRPVYRPRKRPAGGAIGGGAPLRMGRRVRPKLAASYTATQTRRQRRRFRKGVTKAGDNATQGYSHMGGTKYKSLWFNKVKTLGVRSWEDGTATTVTSYNGTQGILLMPGFHTRSQLKTISDSMATTNTTSKCIVGTGKTVLHIKNQSPILVKCKLYEFYTKRTGCTSGTYDPKAAWYKYIIDQSIDSLTVNDIKETPSTFTVNGAHRVDMNPYCADVSHYFKIAKMTSLHLEPGMQHNHTITHDVYKILKREVWEDTDALQVSIGGWTRHFMIVFYSGLVHNKDVNQSDIVTGGASLNGVKTASGEITVSNVTLDVVCRHSFKWLIDSTSTENHVEDSTYPYRTDLADLSEEHMGESNDIRMSVLAND